MLSAGLINRDYDDAKIGVHHQLLFHSIFTVETSLSSKIVHYLYNISCIKVSTYYVFIDLIKLNIFIRTTA